MFLQDFGSLFKSQITCQSNLHIVTHSVDMTEHFGIENGETTPTQYRFGVGS